MRYRVRHPEIAAGVALFAIVGMISMAGTSSAAYEPYEIKKEAAAATERQYAELVSDGQVADQRRAESLLSSKLVEGERAAAAAEAERQRKAAAEEASRSAARAAQATAAAKKPAAQTSFANSAAWAASAKARAVAWCESRGNPLSVNASGKYRGKWQMSSSFWAGYGGLAFAARPELASEAQQDEVAYRGWLARGWQPWSCA